MKNNFEYTVSNLKKYPQNGLHQKCVIGELPFDITKGRDAFWFIDKDGKERLYNYCDTKTDQRWIVMLTKNANPSLQKIFNIKLSNNIEKIVEYCKEIYTKSLKMEIKRLRNELKEIS